jgi:hypothetical protein
VTAPRVMWRDDTAPHQIRLFFEAGGAVAVSCTCRRTRQPGGGTHGHVPFEARKSWDNDEYLAVWRVHLPAEEGR